MRRETVPQHVRSDVPAHDRALHAVLDPQPQRHRRERRPTLREEYICRRTRRHEFGSPGFKVTVQCLHRLAPDRHDAFLVALADDIDEASFEVELFQAQIAKFGEAQAGRVGEFENGLIAKRVRRGRIFRREEFINLGIRERLGQTLPASR